MAVGEEFDVSLVTYSGLISSISMTLRVDCKTILTSYVRQWSGPVILVLYYNESTAKDMREIQTIASTLPTLSITSVLLTSEVIPINQFKNLGIAQVKTTHFIVVDFNLYPSSTLFSLISFPESLYRTLKSTPGYLWRDPYFIGVIPAFEWSHPAYPKSRENEKWFSWNSVTYRDVSKTPTVVSTIESCLHDYTCRPVQTMTIPFVAILVSYDTIAVPYIFIYSFS